MIKEIVHFHRSHHSIVGVVWLTAIAIGFIFSWPTKAADLFTFIALSGAVGGLAITLLVQYEGALIQRMMATDGGPEWMVKVNGVTAGSISDATYAKILHAFYFDVRTHVMQLLNFGKIVTCVIEFLFRSIPLVIFWSAVACYFFAPATFTETIDAFRNATSAEVSAALSQTVWMFGVVATLVIGVSAGLLDNKFGFRYRFDEEYNNLLRRLVKCPAEGEITLYRMEVGYVHQ